MGCCWRGFEIYCPCEDAGGGLGIEGAAEAQKLPKPGEDPGEWESKGVFCLEVMTMRVGGECQVRLRPVSCDADAQEAG
jgi:hypothetical protein